jgi:IS30 family transposase
VANCAATGVFAATDPNLAHELSQARMRACENGPRVADKTWADVKTRLEETWSPQQISDYLKANGHPGVSHESS